MNYTKKQIGHKNAYRLHFPNGAEFLQSYATPVAAYIPGLGFMATTTKFSRTTSKQITQWRQLHGYPLVAAVEQREIEDWMHKMEAAK